jgi:hypothetical protein
MVSYGDDVDLYPRATWEVDPAAMGRFLAAVDARYGSARALLADHGVTPDVVEELTDVFVEPRLGGLVDVTETIVIAADPDAVWKVAGDVGAIAEWVPAIESSRLEGDVRHATFAGGGGDATERIVSRDDAARSYVYEYLSGPLPLEVYRSRMSVRGHGDGAEVVWEAEFTAGSAAEETQLATAIGGIYRSALETLQKRLEA